MEILLGGADYCADDAAAYGWINRSVRDDELDEVVDDLARRIANFPNQAVRLAKRRVNAITLPPNEDVYLDSSFFLNFSRSPELTRRMAALFEAGM